MQKILAKCIQEFENDAESMLVYEAVRRVFENYQKNIDKVNVLLKFTILNNLYWTNIRDRNKMVNHIHNLAIKHDLDKHLKLGNDNIVNKIRRGHKIRKKSTGKEFNFYSFAIKYCHFSNPKCYSIYDRFVDKAIMNLRKSNYIQFRKQEDLHEPETFRGIIDQVIQKFRLVDYQQADRALWVYGQYLDGSWSI